MAHPDAAVASVNSHGDAQLIKVIAVLLLAKGILIDQDTLLQLSDIAIEYFHKLSNLLQNYTEIQRRKKPLVNDVKLLFRLNSINPQSLYVEAQNSKFIHEKYSEDLAKIADNAPTASEDDEEFDSESLPFFNNQQYEISELVHIQTKRPNYIPAYLPDLPPDYTYQNTPSYMDTITDLKTLRVNLVNQSRSTEKSLYNLIDDDQRKWKEKFESELEQLSEVEDIMSDYDLESPMHEVAEDDNVKRLSGGDGDHEDAENGQVAKSSNIVEPEKQEKQENENVEVTVQEPVQEESVKESAKGSSSHEIEEKKLDSVTKDTVSETKVPAIGNDVEMHEESQGTVEGTSIKEDAEKKVQDEVAVTADTEKPTTNGENTLPTVSIENTAVVEVSVENKHTSIVTAGEQDISKLNDSVDRPVEETNGKIIDASKNSVEQSDINRAETSQEIAKEELKSSVENNGTADNVVLANHVTLYDSPENRKEVVDLTEDSNSTGFTASHKADNIEKTTDTTKFDFIAYAQLRRSIVERQQEAINNRRLKRQKNIYMQAEKYYGPYAQFELNDEIDNKFKTKVVNSFKSCIKSIRIEEAVKQQKIQEIIDQKREQEKQAELERKKSEFVFGFNPNNHYSSSEDEEDNFDEFPDFQVHDNTNKPQEHVNTNVVQENEIVIATLPEASEINIASISNSPNENNMQIDDDSDNDSGLGLELENIMQEQQKSETPIVESNETPVEEDSDEDEDMEDV